MTEIDVKTLMATQALNIVDSLRDSILILNNLQVNYANKAFYLTFKVTPQNTIGKKIYDVGNGQWNIPNLKVFIEEVLSKNQEFNDYKVIHNFPDIGEKVMLLNGRQMQQDNALTLLVISDISNIEKANDVLKKTYTVTEKANDILNSSTINREIKMSELKEEIASLKKTISNVLPKINH